MSRTLRSRIALVSAALTCLLGAACSGGSEDEPSEQNIEHASDVCTNLAGHNATVPEGYVKPEWPTGELGGDVDRCFKPDKAKEVEAKWARLVEENKQELRRQRAAERRKYERLNDRLLSRVEGVATPNAKLRIVMSLACDRRYSGNVSGKEVDVNGSWVTKTFARVYDQYWYYTPKAPWPHSFEAALLRACPDQVALFPEGSKGG